MRNLQNGNILFLILIAVALFAALSYAVTGSNRTTGNTIESEKAKLSRGEFDSYMAAVETGKNRLKLLNNCSVIYFTPPADQVAGDKSCFLFHAEGGGVAYRNFDNCPDENILQNLDIGQRCGGLVYAGISGGNRIYTTSSDLGLFSWNSGANNPPWTATGATSASDGFTNTNILVNSTDIGSPYVAAENCRALGEKWYLPADNEMQLLHSNKDLIGGFDFTDEYWTSREVGAHAGRTIHFPAGNLDGSNKNVLERVRCVRRD